MCHRFFVLVALAVISTQINGHRSHSAEPSRSNKPDGEIKDPEFEELNHLPGHRNYPTDPRGDAVNAQADPTVKSDTKKITPDSYFNRGVVHNLADRKTESIGDYTKVIKRNPKHYKALNNRGIIFSEQGIYEQAFADFKEAIEAAPKRPSAYFNRGFTYTKIGEYTSAIRDFDKVIELLPNDVEAFHHRAMAFYKNKELEKARADLKKARELKQKQNNP